MSVFRLQIDPIALLNDAGETLHTLGLGGHGAARLEHSSLPLETDLTDVIGGARLNTSILLPLRRVGSLLGKEGCLLGPGGGGAVAGPGLPGVGPGPPGGSLGHQDGGLGVKLIRAATNSILSEHRVGTESVCSWSYG